MKIGLYFGSFNPIHTGHLIIAEHVLNYADVDRVWLVISPQNPLKPSASLLGEYDRLHLVNLAIENSSRLKAVDVEFRLPKPSYTITTLTYLTEKYPTDDFTVILGSDSFNNLPKWRNYEQLIRDYSFLIYLRPGFPVKDIEPGINASILQAPMLDISASFIRNNIHQDKSIRFLVPDKVFDYIQMNNYYKLM
ncbi:nicotinate (nicotinamide) nucleotide adenylyltransferase [Arachidicoccus ginsenosidivorans]|uniref:Probable nicotinate-nucleotide adenylyltransferase n=1 Tax=Arachidicoccus ginsenosidivorans TaxID=496057 RepID=A0A5B8VJV5_9BACT|nr:nicotinate (nicotinamide) nucleotide adenylyltransferase [Arachidicoccus ginsenosidivorans]QEC71760.1 nicotinate-nucleotide adenylyltransferase [Arachidicoccus ginsenosidivorans]